MPRVMPSSTRSSLRLQECQYDQMFGDGKPKLDDPAVANDAFAIGQIDFDVVMVEKRLVERIDRFVHGFLCNEEQSSVERVVIEFSAALAAS